ncbi:hypothetical protein DFH09DRAFT_1090988 [Mycena vulgaris]|nr:hypothetical protein DFH09DRAFT_1090988 [Mycena vulgaris]
MPTVIFSCFQLEKSTQTLRLHVGNHDQELPRTQHKQYTVDLYDPLKRPSRPSFDGPLLEEKNGRREGHGTRSTGAVEPSRRQRAAALVLLRELEKARERTVTPHEESYEESQRKGDKRQKRNDVRRGGNDVINSETSSRSLFESPTKTHY